MNEVTAPQAEPVSGRTFPTKARGARPTFFDDDGATDAVLAIVTALSAEVWALRERIDVLEAVLERNGTIDRADVEAHQSGPEEDAAQAREAAAFTSRVFRVFEEMREEIVAGETQEQYLAVVRRAFDEI
jgi:hypothetical protein